MNNYCKICYGEVYISDKINCSKCNCVGSIVHDRCLIIWLKNKNAKCEVCLSNYKQSRYYSIVKYLEKINNNFNTNNNEHLFYSPIIWERNQRGNFAVKFAIHLFLLLIYLFLNSIKNLKTYLLQYIVKFFMSLIFLIFFLNFNSDLSHIFYLFI